jgi:hypothetical protein
MCSSFPYLLIVACSQRKRSDPGLLPAIERYDGVHFRVLRKAQREGYWPAYLDVLIVSAKYGLLELHTAIAHYDLRMTLKQAIQIRPLVLPMLAERIESMTYAEVFLNVGKTYQVSLEGWNVGLSRDTIVVYANGGIGQRARQMRSWLIEKTGGDRGLTSV